ncbi:DUF1304 family protein [uncultured Roseobacter sp.]|uniref:DUF1304 family protein n=1 Tax=uncultured Roseobacter sp. TaxID=114847 RepID=UPI00261E7206|nr:DUF1304 family protein [uncultured Roseobacter sp.]
MLPFYLLALLTVILGHFIFAYLQWFKWPGVCKRLTDLANEEAIKTISLGRSFASYNGAIAIGLCLSFLLPEGSQRPSQAIVLALIVGTAAVGASGTKGNMIIKYRLMPAAAALVFWLLNI